MWVITGLVEWSARWLQDQEVCGSIIVSCVQSIVLRNFYGGTTQRSANTLVTLMLTQL